MGSSGSKNSSDAFNSSLPALESEQAFAKNKRQLEPDVIGAKLASKAQVVAMFGHDAIYKDENEKDQLPTYRHHPSPVKITSGKPDGKFYFVSVDAKRAQLPMYGKELEFSEKVFKKENEIEDNEENTIDEEEEQATELQEEQVPALESENSRVSFMLQDDVAIISPRKGHEEEMHFPIVPESEEPSDYEERITENSNTLEDSHPTAIPLQVS